MAAEKELEESQSVEDANKFLKGVFSKFKNINKKE